MIDVVNTIARDRNTDTHHRLRYMRDGTLCSLTMAELDSRANAVAGKLRELGVGPRDRVGIMASNSLEWVLLDIAVLKLSATTAGFEPGGRFESDRIVHDFGLTVLFTDNGDTGARIMDLSEVGAWSDGDPEPVSPRRGYDPADICAIKFTSGSTGMPKGLEVTVASVNNSITAVQEMFAHGDGDDLLVFLGNWFLQQRYWIYSGLVFGHDVTLAAIDDAIEVAATAAPTVVMGVPGFYEQVKSRIEADRGPVNRELIQQWLGGRIRYLWTGSAPAGRALLEFFNDNGVPLYEGYGLNETCIVAKNHPGAFRLGSVGKVLPDKTVRFDKDNVLIVGSRHPVNTRYTWCAPGANEKTFLPTSEVKTYDVGYVDADGFLFVQGRVDDVIALGTGYNVLAPVVEHRLREHPAVHECVLYGSGRQYVTAIVSPGGSDVDRDELRRFVARRNEELLPEQRIHGLVLTAERFSIDNGLLTGQFKPKRKDIHARYAAELESLYSQELNATDVSLVVEQVEVSR